MKPLTEDQRRELEDTGELVLLDTTSGKKFAVVQIEVYQQVYKSLGLDSQAVGELIDRNMTDEDAGDPLLESYEKYA